MSQLKKGCITYYIIVHSNSLKLDVSKSLELIVALSCLYPYCTKHSRQRVGGTVLLVT